MEATTRLQRMQIEGIAQRFLAKDPLGERALSKVEIRLTVTCNK